MTNETNIASEPLKLKKIDMTQAIVLFFKNYFNFSGRASRGEFWWFYLAYILATIVCAVADVFIGGFFYGLTDSELISDLGLLSNILSLVTLVGWVSLTARRLQDVGRTGWWQLGYFIIIPAIILWTLFIVFDGNTFLLLMSIIFSLASLALYILIFVWLVSALTQDENQWGRNPLLS